LLLLGLPFFGKVDWHGVWSQRSVPAGLRPAFTAAPAIGFTGIYTFPTQSAIQPVLSLFLFPRFFAF